MLDTIFYVRYKGAKSSRKVTRSTCWRVEKTSPKSLSVSSLTVRSNWS